MPDIFDSVSPQEVRGIKYWIQYENPTTPADPYKLFIRAAPGQVVFTNGGYSYSYTLDESGDLVKKSRRIAQQAGPSTIAFSGVKVNRAGGGTDPLEFGIPDIQDPQGALMQGGNIGEANGCLSVPAGDVYMQTPDCGDQKGATYCWEDCAPQAGSTLNPTSEGFVGSWTMESTSAGAIITPNP